MTTKQIDPEFSEDPEHAKTVEDETASGDTVISKEAREVESTRGKNQETESQGPEKMDEDGNSSFGADEDDLASLSPTELADALMAARSQINEMKDSFLRAKAEMENIRRRSQNEVVSARKYAIEGFAQELLNVFDSLDQAAQVELAEGAVEAVVKMKEGLGLTLKQMESVMNKFAVTEVEAGPGVKFDPEQHQAISMVVSDQVESNHIINVMQKGFLLKDRLLRPAMVVVAS
jgi:molecular chaperone GrpE